jgi:hypothetical protein
MEDPVHRWHQELIPALDKTERTNDALVAKATEEDYDIMIGKLTEHYKHMLFYF